MSLFDFSSRDKLLMVGEGNFSFSCCLLKRVQEKFGVIEFSNVYATCYQKDLSTSASANVSFLKSKGAEVILGVDATKLELAQTVSSMKFNKIIFNFPHVGGKMKIHLNRELLKNFFVSCSNMLLPGGQVIVTLCSGQGGTGFEIVSRRWDDTWQIIEQASHGSFVLFDIQHFPHLLFEGYEPVGYRGREQMFCTKSAVIHGFCQGTPPTTYLQDSIIDGLLNFHPVDNNGDLQVSYCHKVSLCLNPLESKYSPQNYITGVLLHIFKKYSNNFINVSDELDYHTLFDSSQATCLYKQKKCSLRKSLLQVIRREEEQDLFAKGLVFQKCSSDFNNVCASCHCVIRSPENRRVIRDFITNCSNVFNSSLVVFDEKNNDFWEMFFESEDFPREKVAWGDLKSDLGTIDIDVICSRMFCISIRELWTEELKFDELKNKLIFPSLYPLLFKFDICFGSHNDLDFEEFYHILHQIPDKLIESVNLLSIYQPGNSNEKCYCFRISYRSFKIPLYRKIVIEIHQNVVGRILEKALNVLVR